MFSIETDSALLVALVRSQSTDGDPGVGRTGGTPRAQTGILNLPGLRALLARAPQAGPLEGRCLLRLRAREIQLLLAATRPQILSNPSLSCQYHIWNVTSFFNFIICGVQWLFLSSERTSPHSRTSDCGAKNLCVYLPATHGLPASAGPLPPAQAFRSVAPAFGLIFL